MYKRQGVSSLNNFKFYSNSTELVGAGKATIRDTAGVVLTGSTSLNANSGSKQIIVRLTGEETVTGSGTVYELRATPTLGSDTSTKTVTTSFYRPSQSTVTGYIADDGGPNQWNGVLGIFGLGAYASGTKAAGVVTWSSATGTFLWSDKVDVPHSYASGTYGGMVGSGGSGDWTNDVYVESLNDSLTLSN